MPWNESLAADRLLRTDTWRVLVRYAGSVRRNSPRGTLENIAALFEDIWFDWRYGTDTGGFIELHELNVRSGNRYLGCEYTPTRVRAFHKLMAWLDLPANGVFMDFGCGKGRVLCAAGNYPFRRIVGVEFAAELNEICRQNLNTYRARFQPHTEVSLIEADVVDYAFAGDEDVLFFFNPFRSAVMERVLENFRASLASHPRTVRLIVSNPDELVPVLESDPVLTRIANYAYGSSRFVIYSNRPS